VRTNTHTFYLRYTGPLPGNSNVKVDITINEALFFPLAKRPVLRGYAEFTDIPVAGDANNRSTDVANRTLGAPLIRIRG